VTGQSVEDFATAVAALRSIDGALDAQVTAHGDPPFWTREPGFATLVLFILEQQVSLASAAAAFDRLAARTGVVTPDAIFASSDEQLRSDGFSRQKAGYVRALASELLTGALDLTALADQADHEVRRILLRLKGVGPWTADVYLMSCLRRPDIWPVGDRALQVAASEALALATVPTAGELEEIGKRWHPNRSTAARILWHGYLSRRGRQT
jgi:DNA-3-methyladenine glycosylase II